MSAILSNLGSVTIGGSDLGGLTGWSYDISQDLADASDFGDTERLHLVGMTDTTITLDCLLINTNTGNDLLRVTNGAVLALVLQIDANQSLSGNIIVESHGVSAGIDGAVTLTASGKATAQFTVDFTV